MQQYSSCNIIRYLLLAACIVLYFKLWVDYTLASYSIKVASVILACLVETSRYTAILQQQFKRTLCCHLNMMRVKYINLSGSLMTVDCRLLFCLSFKWTHTHTCNMPVCGGCVWYAVWMIHLARGFNCLCNWPPPPARDIVTRSLSARWPRLGGIEQRVCELLTADGRDWKLTQLLIIIIKHFFSNSVTPATFICTC